MSERFCGNSEEPTGDEFDFEAIDHEWEKLNEHLEEQKARRDEQAEQRAEFDTARNEIMQRFRESDILRVVDIDDKDDSKLFYAFADHYQDKVIDASREANEPLDEEFTRQLAMNTIIKYYEECEIQRTLITEITTLRYLATAPSLSNASRVYALILKKQLQADMLIHHNFNLDGVWQRFVDEAVPGEGLDIMNDYDLHYIRIAQQNLYEFQLEKQHNQRVLDGLKELVGLDENGEIEDVVAELSSLIIMRDEAARPVFSEEQRSNRNAELWGGAREMRLSDEIAKKVVDFLDEQYPIVY